MEFQALTDLNGIPYGMTAPSLTNGSLPPSVGINAMVATMLNPLGVSGVKMPTLDYTFTTPVQVLINQNFVFSSTNSVLLRYTPQNPLAPVVLFFYDDAGKYISKRMVINYDQDLSQNYDQFRYVSGYLSAKGGTVTGTDFQLSGTITAISTGANLTLETSHMNTVLGIDYPNLTTDKNITLFRNSNEVITAVPDYQGVIALGGPGCRTDTAPFASGDSYGGGQEYHFFYPGSSAVKYTAQAAFVFPFESNLVGNSIITLTLRLKQLASPPVTGLQTVNVVAVDVFGNNVSDNSVDIYFSSVYGQATVTFSYGSDTPIGYVMVPGVTSQFDLDTNGCCIEGVNFGKNDDITTSPAAYMLFTGQQANTTITFGGCANFEVCPNLASSMLLRPTPPNHDLDSLSNSKTVWEHASQFGFSPVMTADAYVRFLSNSKVTSLSQNFSGHAGMKEWIGKGIRMADQIGIIDAVPNVIRSLAGLTTGIHGVGHAMMSSTGHAGIEDLNMNPQSLAMLSALLKQNPNLLTELKKTDDDRIKSYVQEHAPVPPKPHVSSISIDTMMERQNENYSEYFVGTDQTITANLKNFFAPIAFNVVHYWVTYFPIISQGKVDLWTMYTGLNPLAGRGIHAVSDSPDLTIQCTMNVDSATVENLTHIVKLFNSTMDEHHQVHYLAMFPYSDHGEYDKIDDISMGLSAVMCLQNAPSVIYSGGIALDGSVVPIGPDVATDKVNGLKNVNMPFYYIDSSHPEGAATWELFPFLETNEGFLGMNSHLGFTSLASLFLYLRTRIAPYLKRASEAASRAASNPNVQNLYPKISSRSGGADVIAAMEREKAERHVNDLEEALQKIGSMSVEDLKNFHRILTTPTGETYLGSEWVNNPTDEEFENFINGSVDVLENLNRVTVAQQNQIWNYIKKMMNEGRGCNLLPWNKFIPNKMLASLVSISPLATKTPKVTLPVSRVAARTERTSTTPKVPVSTSTVTSQKLIDKE